MERQTIASGPRALLETARHFLSSSSLLPLIVISIAFGGLAYRSYQLSERMEQGVNMLAIQYVGYSSDIGARQLDGAIRDEIFDASESWQKIERRDVKPRSEGLQEWLNQSPWIVSAIYVPDSDPTDSLYVTELADPSENLRERITHEFYTASGSVRFTYDPSKILMQLSPLLRQKQPQELSLKEGVNFQQQGQSLIARSKEGLGLKKTASGFSFATPLASPFNSFAVRSSVQMGYLGSGWESQKIISALFTGAALIVAILGVLMAIRGIRRESEATQLRAALIANVSHELRTPLSMIRLGAETLSHGDKLNEKERTDILSSILREVIHLSHMVENVLDVARLRKAGKPLVFAPVYPDEIIMSVIDNYEAWLHSKGFALEIEMDDLIEEQMWDREAMSRALLNLVDNAVKYSLTDKRIRIELRQQDGRIILEVQDHGVGIPVRDLTRVFEPYYRAEFSDTETRRGAGLGLTLVQQIVESHGGRIEVESVQGRGSTFRMIFPEAAHPQEAPEKRHLLDAPTVQGRTG